MSNPSSCCTSCDTPETVSVPGLQGQNAFTTTTASYLVPALGANVTVSVVSSGFMVVGQTVAIEGGGVYEVVSTPTATSAVLEYLNIASNTQTGSTIASGSKVGPGGPPGSDGADGENSFTVTTASFVVPAISGTVTITVASSDWMTVGQNIFIQGAGTFSVDSKADSTHATLTYLDYDSNTASTNTINSGAQVSPGGFQPTTPLTVAEGGTNAATANDARDNLGVGGDSLSVYAAGTAYQFTNTSAALTFGTTSPSLTISAAGTWLLLARVRVDYTAATFAAVRTVTLKLRRTNNTAADVANSSAGMLTEIITTLTYTADTVNLPPVVYVTTNTNDAIAIFGDVSTVPSAGSLDASQAEIVAIKLFDQTV